MEQTEQRLQSHPEIVRRQLVRGIRRDVKCRKLWRVPESVLLEPMPGTPTNRKQAIRAARGAMKSASHTIMTRFLEEK